jgi:anti-anti-sigma factor
MAAPIFDDGQLVGVLAVQLSVERINRVMTNDGKWKAAGLGDSGEVYLVGADRLLRSESRFFVQDRENYLRQIASGPSGQRVARLIERAGSGIGLQPVSTLSSQAASSGEWGTGVITDYRGVRVMSAYRPLSIPGFKWVILSEIDEAEALEDATRLRRDALVVALALMFAALLTAYFISGLFTARIRELTRRATSMAQGELDTPVEVGGSDEIADLAKSFEAMRRSLVDQLEARERSIDALATPIIAITRGVVALPLVGEMDPERVDKVRERLVASLERGSARVAVIDVTGVPTMDAGVASSLARVAKAARLVGARVIICGMRPAVAETLAMVGVDLDGIHTERDLEAAVQLARRWDAA